MSYMIRCLKFSAYPTQNFHCLYFSFFFSRESTCEDCLWRNVAKSVETVRAHFDCFWNFQDEVRRTKVTHHFVVVRTKAERFSEAQSDDETLCGLDWVPTFLSVFSSLR